MSVSSLLTAEQFAERRFDLPDGGRWSELVSGEIVTLEPPDEMHGTVVLNLSRALARYAQQPSLRPRGYACFEVGLIVDRQPDTVRCPAVSWFTGGEAFAEVDKAVTEAVPDLVIEVASTRRRRIEMRSRVESYLNRGTAAVWTVDPVERQVHISERSGPVEVLAEDRRLRDEVVLRGFSMGVGELFAEPSWWRRSEG